jgi:Zinc dependent phospholipase C
MPGHFTHIYTARRVADLLSSGEFTDWPASIPELNHFKPEECGAIMKQWEKFTAVGAIGPDLFYFSQDYNSAPLGPLSDELMLALATYYYFDAAKEEDWEPLLIILEQVNSTMAGLLRFLIRLQKIWDAFVADWNQTIGPLVSAATNIPDALTGGLLSEFKVAIEELKVALKMLGEEELLTFKDIFTMMDTCVQKAFDEQSFLWSDMSHYRRPSAMCRALVKQAQALQEEALKSGDDNDQRWQQLLAFALGYITHFGTDTVAHSFVNEQCGGPFRNHPQRHHLIENHIDAWNYSQTSADSPTTPNRTIPADPWGFTPTYPDLSMSALWFAVQLTPDEPNGDQRPDPLPDDPTDRKQALDVDGELPDWMTDAIVRAMIDAFADGPHPKIFGGSSFQAAIDSGLLSKIIQNVTGHGPNAPFNELLEGIAATPDFDVPRGFPLPWQIQTMYRIMISFYKFSFNGSWELQKPRKPDFIITPPASDFENLLQPPDVSGVDSSNPVEDVCSAIIALFDWAIKELEAAITLAEDLIKMAASPGSYLLRLGIYELAMMVWDVITKTHEVLAHTGFVAPHSGQTYDDGELRLPNEIDLPLITLGQTVDNAFRAALAGAIDPFGNLDKDPNAIGTGHSVQDSKYPYYPVLRFHVNDKAEDWEYHRPWAYPNVRSRDLRCTWARLENVGALPERTDDRTGSEISRIGACPAELSEQLAGAT